MSVDVRADLPRVSIQADDFDLSTELRRLQGADHQIGALVSFVGTVREWTSEASSSEKALGLELEHYPGMTQASIEAMIDQALARFDIRQARVIHRVGRLALGDQIVLVMVSSSHRAAAFSACEFLMDWLKTQAPFWKKEISVQGERWVQAKASDDAAAMRWGSQ